MTRKMDLRVENLLAIESYSLAVSFREINRLVSAFATV